jgi:predicted glycoside hydrolase/deacetylase ChbG (UPF0249 family)
MPERTQTVAQLLGYPDDARLLIINADDFGMCHAENVATMSGLQQGAFGSSTIMVPCPWFDEVVAFARRVPEVDLGVHITHTSEWASYRWGPVAGRSVVPSLVDPLGYFHRNVESLYARARLDEVEVETRAQIDRALAAGIDVTHLDSHMGTVQLDPDYHDLYVRLAGEYRLPIRMASRSGLRSLGMGRIIEQADRLGVLSPDHFWYGGPPAPEATAAYWSNLLRTLKPGVTELYVHAALDAPEMRAVTDTWAQRVADFEYFAAASTRVLLDELGIVRLGYRPLRELQRRLQAC